MSRIRFRLIHLLILMTIICISIPSYFSFKEYQRKKQIERFKQVTSEYFETANAIAKAATNGPTTPEDMEVITQKTHHLNELHQQLIEANDGLDEKVKQGILRRLMDEAVKPESL